MQPTVTRVGPTPKNNIPKFGPRRFVGKGSTAASRRWPNTSKIEPTCPFSDRYSTILSTMRRCGGLPISRNSAERNTNLFHGTPRNRCRRYPDGVSSPYCRPYPQVGRSGTRPVLSRSIMHIKRMLRCGEEGLYTVANQPFTFIFDARVFFIQTHVQATATPPFQPALYWRHEQAMKRKYGKRNRVRLYHTTCFATTGGMDRETTAFFNFTSFSIFIKCFFNYNLTVSLSCSFTLYI